MSDTQYLAKPAARLVAAARALEAAIKADDVELVQAAHEAVGRARSRMAPQVANAVRAQERRQQATQTGVAAVA